MKANLILGLFLLPLFFICNEISNAQTPNWLWANAIGGTGNDKASSVVFDPVGNGDFYATGYFTGPVDFDPGPGTFNLGSGGWDLFISKFDTNGNLLWAKKIGGGGQDWGSFITIDPSGNGDIYFTGAFEGSIDFKPGAGTVNLTSNGNRDIFISKFDPSGNFIWGHSMGGSNNDVGQAIAIDPSGNGDIYFTGEYRDTVDFDPDTSQIFNLASIAKEDIFISKFDSSGNFKWAKAIGGTGIDYSNAIAFDPSGDGSLYITGNFEKTIDFDPGLGTFNVTSLGTDDIYITKLDKLGSYVWTKVFGGTGYDWGLSIAVAPTGSGDIYLTGGFENTVDFNPGAGTLKLTSNGSRDIFISKLDSSGNLIWVKTMGGTGEDYGYYTAIDPNGSGSVYTIGYFEGTVDFDPGPGVYNLTSAGLIDIFISKLDNSGNFEWVKSMGGTGGDYGETLALDAFGHALVAGYFFSTTALFDSIALVNGNFTGVSWDMFFAKLDISHTTSVSDILSQNITIYPNPATEALTIEMSDGKFFRLEIKLFNILGEVVFSSPIENISHQKTIDISDLAAGIYFVQVNIDGNKVMKKVVKE